MSEAMGLVVVSAAGRMGQTLIRAIAAAEGVRLVGAVERQGAPQIGRDAGDLAGVGNLGVAITEDPLQAFAKAEASSISRCRQRRWNLPAMPRRRASPTS